MHRSRALVLLVLLPACWSISTPAAIATTAIGVTAVGTSAALRTDCVSDDADDWCEINQHGVRALGLAGLLTAAFGGFYVWSNETE